jgi:aspartate/tyrosine/aromatic aminotransferase
MTLDKLKEIPADAILGLMTAFRADPSSQKIDLTVGVYRDDHGNTPVMRAVAAAEERLVDQQTTKSYISPLGVDGFRDGIREMVLGPLDGSHASRTRLMAAMHHAPPRSRLPAAVVPCGLPPSCTCAPAPGNRST